MTFFLSAIGRFSHDKYSYPHAVISRAFSSRTLRCAILREPAQRFFLLPQKPSSISHIRKVTRILPAPPAFLAFHTRGREDRRKKRPDPRGDLHHGTYIPVGLRPTRHLFPPVAFLPPEETTDPLDLLTRLVLYEASETGQETSYDTNLQEVLSYMLANKTSAITVNAIASKFGYNPKYFITLFRRKEGVTPK